MSMELQAMMSAALGKIACFELRQIDEAVLQKKERKHNGEGRTS